MPQYESTSLSLNEEDQKMREALDAEGISVVDTWRRGARELIKKIKKEPK